jgi:hypothetical protein
MALAMLIDCTDGTLARRARVKDVLPHFDAHTASTTSSMEFVMANRPTHMGAAMGAIGAAIQQHADERAAVEPVPDSSADGG